MSTMIGKPIGKSKSLECTCDIFQIRPYINKKYISRCDFCSENCFIKSTKTKSTPTISIFD